MNSTIRKKYTFKKKIRSFDKTYGLKYILSQHADLKPLKIDFCEIDSQMMTEEDNDIDLEEIKIIEETQSESVQLIMSREVDKNQTHTKGSVLNFTKKVQQIKSNYGLIYRVKKCGFKQFAMPCKVSLRNFKLTDLDLEFRANFESYNLEFLPPGEIDFLSPIDSFSQMINELVFQQLQ